MVERQGTVFQQRARATASSLMHALLPPGVVYPPASNQTVDRLEGLLREAGGSGAILGYSGLLEALENATRLTHWGRSFSSLAPTEAAAFLTSCADAGFAKRALYLGLTAPLKIAYYDDPEIYRRKDCTWEHRQPAEPAPWMSNIQKGSELTADEAIEADAVVVGTGAGGGVVAKELAERGLGVVLVEEGEHHRRDAFTGHSVSSIKKFYGYEGRMASVGNCVIPIPMGKMVGGSTAINSGTCWRTPPWVLEHWTRERGLAGLSPELMAPYFARVEQEIGVSLPDAKALGGVPRVIARGCDSLGYKHGPVLRNAPGCDGAGVCDFGCPTDAKRSTNISYVPSALKRGAALYTGIKVERVLVDGGRAVGIEGVASNGKRLKVRARATVLSCGALATPVFLARQGLARGLAHVGRNLSIHPATSVSALLDEEIKGYNAIPQGYGVTEFHRDGILMLGASAPIDVGAVAFPFAGEKLVRIMEAYDRVASFGAMVEDDSNGRVVPGPGGRPLVFYWLGQKERDRLRQATAALARIFLAAGASEVFPGVRGHRSIRSSADLKRLAASNPAASDWLLLAFHPLGTCRMARSAKEGVVSSEHEVFGVPGLHVVDGSSVPSSVAVNPQVTIMAMATRAADLLGEKLERTRS